VPLSEANAHLARKNLGECAFGSLGNLGKCAFAPLAIGTGAAVFAVGAPIRRRYL
jgi:hypothetical protein